MNAKDTEKFVLTMSTNPYQAQRTARGAVEWLKRPTSTQWTTKLRGYNAFDRILDGIEDNEEIPADDIESLVDDIINL